MIKKKKKIHDKRNIWFMITVFLYTECIVHQYKVSGPKTKNSITEHIL